MQVDELKAWLRNNLEIIVEMQDKYSPRNSQEVFLKFKGEEKPFTSAQIFVPGDDYYN